MFFSAKDGEHGRELWRSDGTADGTRLVRDIRPGSGASDPYDFRQLGSWMLFTADDGTHGRELWRTDGTRAGTRMIMHVDAGITGGLECFCIGAMGPRIGGFVYFRGSDGRGAELWRTDGTPSGTRRVRDIRAGSGSSKPIDMTRMGRVAYFGADDGEHGRELWRSNGTKAGTYMVKNISPSRSGWDAKSFPPHVPVVHNDRLYFQARGRGTGRELWKSDGTRRGTKLVRDIRPAPGGSGAKVSDSRPNQLTSAGRFLYFFAESSAERDREELWRTDGTARGTRMLYDESTLGLELEAVQGSVFFSIINPSELWRSDGTRNTTTRVASFEPAYTYPQALSGIDGTLYFSVSDTLWRSDGTTGGTDPVGTPQPAAAGNGTPAHWGFVDAAGAAFFYTAEDGAHGRELWRSDGTTTGTRMVRDIRPGAASADPWSVARVDF